MRLDIMEVRRRFGGYISSQVRLRLQGRDEVDIATVAESVFEDLERIGEIRGEHGDDSLRNLIRRVTVFNCIDHIRRWESKKNAHPRSFQDLSGGGPGGINPGSAFEAAEDRVDSDDLASLAEKYGVKSRNLALLDARIAGRSRAELAAMFGISENSVHCRLVYLRRKIAAAIRKKDRLDSLKAHER